MQINFTWIILLESIWFFLPAYFANSAPTILKGRYPIDFNKNFFDKRPIFGKGKTIDGFISGMIIGVLTGLIENYIWLNNSFINQNFIQMDYKLAILLASGALLGDMTKSFFKRRIGFKRGEQWPFFDQYDSVIGGLIFASFLIRIKIEWLIVIILISPVLHRTSNIIAYKLKLKDVPW